MKGNPTTDFGAPAIAPKADDRRLDEQETERLLTILRASWAALDRVAAAAHALDHAWEIEDRLQPND